MENETPIRISSIGTGSRRDDQERSILMIDCIAILERLGINNFDADRNNRTIHLIDRDDLQKVADYFAFKLYREAEGFSKYGWTFIIKGASA